jgi:hypothetical protein
MHYIALSNSFLPKPTIKRPWHRKEWSFHHRQDGATKTLSSLPVSPVPDNGMIKNQKPYNGAEAFKTTPQTAARRRRNLERQAAALGLQLVAAV